MRKKHPVFAIGLVDEFLAEDVPIENKFTVKQVVAAREIAEGNGDGAPPGGIELAGDNGIGNHLQTAPASRLGLAGRFSRCDGRD